MVTPPAGTMGQCPDMVRRLSRPTTFAAASLAVVFAVVLAVNAGPVFAGHPSYAAFYLAGLALGAAISVRGLRRERGRTRFREWVAAAAMALWAGAGWWLSPFAAEPVALDALHRADGFVVHARPGSISLEPIGQLRDVGIIFFPGARVDARAYARILAPIARDGYPVVIVKEPLGIGLLATGFAPAWAKRHPETSWVVAGHSLGGVAASLGAEDSAVGLVLWASFPPSDISSLDVPVRSVFGTRDLIAEPERILASSEDLPPQTRFVPVEGAIHSFFGDYGLQPGDGLPTVARESAQTEIRAATLSLLREVELGPE